MKELDELILPDYVRYSQTHEWAKAEGKNIRVGISDYAQNRLGDITFVEFPRIGDQFRKGEPCGVLESTKAVAELFTPVSGEIAAVNTDLDESPGLINSDPYGAGWIMEVRPDGRDNLESLLTTGDYRQVLEGLE